MYKILLFFPIFNKPDVQGGLESIKQEVNPLFKIFAEFIGWGGGGICLLVLIGLIALVGIKRSNQEVVDKKVFVSIGVVVAVMVVLGAVGIWSTFFFK